MCDQNDTYFEIIVDVSKAVQYTQPARQMKYDSVDVC